MLSGSKVSRGGVVPGIAGEVRDHLDTREQPGDEGCAESSSTIAPSEPIVRASRGR